MPKSNFQRVRNSYTRDTGKSKQNARLSHVKKYLSNLSLKNGSNRKKERFRFLNSGLSRFSALSKKMSNTYKSQNQPKFLNEKGKKVAMFLQSKFRINKAKQELKRLQNKKLSNSLKSMNTSIKKMVRPARPSPSLRRKPSRTAPVLNLNEKLSNSLKSMSNSIKKLLKPTPNYKPPLPSRPSKPMKPMKINKSSLTQKFNPKLSPIYELSKNKPHWIKAGPKSTHRKATVRRVTKHAPK